MSAAFDWLAFLALAKTLAQTNDEAALRSAVSRAYYALYGSIAVILSAEGFDASTVSDPHYQMWQYLEKNPQGKSQGRTRGVLARYGRELRLFRKKADYDGLIQDVTSLVSDALAKADAMHSLLPNLTKQ